MTLPSAGPPVVFIVDDDIPVRESPAPLVRHAGSLPDLVDMAAQPGTAA